MLKAANIVPKLVTVFLKPLIACYLIFSSRPSICLSSPGSNRPISSFQIFFDTYSILSFPTMPLPSGEMKLGSGLESVIVP